MIVHVVIEGESLGLGASKVIGVFTQFSAAEKLASTRLAYNGKPYIPMHRCRWEFCTDYIEIQEYELTMGGPDEISQEACSD